MSTDGGLVLDRLVRRSDDGRLLVGGAPARLIRLTAAGSAALDSLLAGGPADPASGRLLERLRAAGMVHPVAAPAAVPPLTTIVPVRDGGDDLGPLVARLRELGEVIVVDDGSRDGSALRARAAGARVLANRGAPGPAGARNTGLAQASTELVAFIDADCLPDSDWASGLAALLAEDPRLAVAAPRVRGLPGDDFIARYETGASPLDMGPDPSLVGPGRRVGFVPSAALVARRSALLEIGGFDEARRVGEDVDLVLRLLVGGWRIRYAPELQVAHRSRATLAGLARQRFAYAESASALDHAHPGTVAPLRASPHSLAIWLGLAADPRAGLAALCGSVLLTSRQIHPGKARREVASMALRSHLHSSRHLARALARDWLPLTVLGSLASRRLRCLALVAIAVDVASSSQPDAQPLGPALRASLRQVDNLSYAAGLWTGAARRRSAGALLPALARKAHPADTDG